MLNSRQEALRWAVDVATRAGERGYAISLEELLKEENNAVKHQMEQKRRDAFQSIKYGYGGGEGVYLKEADFNDLPVGTLFYLHNGNWSGSIVEIDGVKHVQIGEEESGGRCYVPPAGCLNELTVHYPDQ